MKIKSEGSVAMGKKLFSDRLYRDCPERPAIIAGGYSCTYRDLHRGINGLSCQLRDMGVEKGTRVALWSYNTANWLIAFFAIARAGGTAVLLNYSMPVEEAADLMTQTGTGFLLYGNNAAVKKDPDAITRLASLADLSPEHCMNINPEVTDLSKTDRAEGEETRSEEEAEETAFIIFSSGTTSRPKAVQISQRALSFDADVFNSTVEGQGGESICIAVPLFHILGLLMSYSYLCRGATVCLPSDYKPDTLAREVSLHHLSDMAAVGAVYLNLAEMPDFSKEVAPYLKLCMIAGGMIAPVQMMRMEIDYDNAIFINMYGQSEAAPLTMVHPSDQVEKRAQTVGKAVDGMEVRIMSSDGTFLPGDEIGEVVAKGPGLMNGYDGIPDDRQPVDSNGWLHTGDLGYFDQDGFLHLSGRMKDIIIRGGENISPSEVENALYQLEYIREAKVMGAPHPIYGESVEACVTMLDGGPAFDQEKIKAGLLNRIPRFKLPAHVFLYERFPLNVNGKLDQKTLRADMLMRLKKLEINWELNGGVTIYDLKIKNSNYAIVPVTRLVSDLAETIGYTKRMVITMRLAVEEMLNERILDAYTASGDIRVKITLMTEWLRISFSDNGTEYFIDKRRDTSTCARNILSAVSDFHTDYMNGKPVYCMDFLYEKELDIREFLLKSMEASNAGFDF